MGNFRKILISRTDHIGDVLLSTPVVGLLKKKFPDTFVSFLTSRYASVVLKNNPDIKEILYIEDENLVSELRNRRFDSAVVLFPTFEVCRKIFMAKIPLRIGPASKWFVPLFLNKPIFQHRSRVEKHEVEYNLDLLAPLGVEPEKVNLNFVVSSEAKTFAMDWKSKNDISDDDNFVIMHPCMKGSALNWPLKCYAELADRLVEGKRAKVLLSCGPGEEDVIRDLAGLMREKPIVLDKVLDLSFLAGLISEADLVVCPSTGILHLAVAVGIKTVSVFPPILVQSKKRWGPYSEGHLVFEPPVSCGRKFRCQREKCLCYNCMQKITVDSVYERI